MREKIHWQLNAKYDIDISDMTESKTRVETLLKEFHTLSSWEERYQKIIGMGKSLPSMDPAQQTEENKIRGCQSQVWLTVQVKDNRILHFEADSDALIVKGLISLLLFIYQDLTPAEILATSPHFLREIGLDQHLSPSRSNGLQAMVKQIQYYAAAYQHLLKR